MINIIKTVFKLCFAAILFAVIVLQNHCYAENMNSDIVLKSGISLIEQVPKGLIGAWRVRATLVDSNSPSFKNSSIDIWNLSKSGDVIELENPFSGASANININYVSGNCVRFVKTGNYDTKRLTDIVELRLNGDTFSGKNKLKLESLSDVDGSVIKTETALYNLKGDKISGMSVLEK